MIWSIFLTSIKEQLQRPAILALTLLTAPFFVFVYGALFPSDTVQFKIAVYNQDTESLIVDYLKESEMYNIEIIETLESLEKKVKDNSVQVGIHILSGFEASIKQLAEIDDYQLDTLVFYGDQSNNMYGPAAIMIYSSIEEYVLNASKRKAPILIQEHFLGISSSLKEFDHYIPGLLVFSLIILIFQVAMNLSKLVETNLLKRLMLSKASAFQILGGYSISVIIVGMLSFLLTLFTAYLMGSGMYGDWFAVFLLAFLCSLAITSCGMIVSAFADTSSGAFIIANVPMMLFMFLSGAMYPIEKIVLFEVNNAPVGLFDLLPTTHAVNGLHTLLIMQGSLGDILYELCSLIVLTTLFTVIGVRLYYTRRMKFD